MTSVATSDTSIEYINAQLHQVLATTHSTEPQLQQAMQYVVLAGGKRIRARLVYATGNCFAIPPAQLDTLASAIELIHCYSLVHDDLPAMDDDDWRRGKPSCHKAFDEATAILTGDALLNLAFEILAKTQAHYSADTQLSLLRLVSEATGRQGMISGQMMDMQNETQDVNLAEIKTMHRLKTGALIHASVMGATEIAVCDDSTLNALSLFASHLGLAFQIQDDILDVEGSTKQLGKTAGKDLQQNKASITRILSLSEAKKELNELLKQMQQQLKQIPYDTQPLQTLVQHII